MNEENNLNIIDTEQKITLPLTILEKYNISSVWFAFFAIAFLFVLYQGVGGIVTLLIIGIKFDESNVNLIRILTISGQIFLLLIPALFFSRLVSCKVKDFLKFNGTNILLYILTLIGIFSLQQILQVYLYVQDMIPLPDQLQKIIQQLKNTIEASYKLVAGAKNFGELVFVLFTVAFIPAIAEETVFRGFFQSTLEKKLSPFKSILLSGIVFGAFHLNPINLIPLMLMGIYLGFLYYQSNSIFIPILAHFFNNLFAVLAIYFGSEDKTLIGIKENNISIEFLLLNFVFFGFIFFFSLYYFVRVSNINFKKTI